MKGQPQDGGPMSEKETTESKEVSPPWIAYPGFPPGDFFWRDAGQPWFAYVWEPYWKSLTTQEQQAYLDKWTVQEDWEWYFDADLQAWLASIDEEH